MITLDILPFTQEEDWSIGSVHKEYTGHLYYGSPFESADSCGTCDGARCDSCHIVVTDDILEFSCTSDKLKSYLMEAGAPEDIADEFAFSDFVGSNYKDYYFPWPSCSKLKEIKPDLYEKLTTLDSEIYGEIITELPNYEIFGDMKDAILAKHGLDWSDVDTFLYKQLELFWKLNGETHDIFKTPDQRFSVSNFGFTEYVFTNPKADSEVREKRKLELSNLRFGDKKPGDWICYCDEEGFWKTGKLQEIQEDQFKLMNGKCIKVVSLLTDVYKIEKFNARRYNGFKDNRLHAEVGSPSRSNIFC